MWSVSYFTLFMSTLISFSFGSYGGPCPFRRYPHRLSSSLLVWTMFLCPLISFRPGSVGDTSGTRTRTWRTPGVPRLLGAALHLHKDQAVYQTVMESSTWGCMCCAVLDDYIFFWVYPCQYIWCVFVNTLSACTIDIFFSYQCSRGWLCLYFTIGYLCHLFLHSG